MIVVIARKTNYCVGAAVNIYIYILLSYEVLISHTVDYVVEYSVAVLRCVECRYCETNSPQ